MNTTLLELEPKCVWKNFRELTLIPRPSKNEAKIIEFMINWAKERSLEVLTDKIQNVIIRKPATPGYENRQGVILQGHLDMVPQKNSDKDHDFVKDPITTLIDGDWVTADNTTLGADNGMGVAAAMAVLEADNLEHGPIEALFTIDEETGMTGAFNLEPNVLKGDILLNLDSEDEGELYIGCAGGIDVTAIGEYKKKPVPENSKAYKIHVSGLKGGHSGIDIPLQRGNANKIMFRLLQESAHKYNLRIASVSGGNMRNAIPREAFAVVTVPAKSSEDFLEAVRVYNKQMKLSLQAVEPNLDIEALHKKTLPKTVMAKSDAKKLLSAVRAVPHGPYRFIDGMMSIPETSTNLAIIEVKKGKISIANLVRSSSDFAKQDVVCVHRSIFEQVGYKVEASGEYPGWKPNFESPILQTMKDTYKKTFGKMPEVKIIHAGLECGILGQAYPNWDMISFGPTIRHPHSPDEKVNVATVGKFWQYLAETLKNIPEKPE